MTGKTNQQSPFSTYAQPPAVETRTQQKIKSPFGEFPDLQSYLTQQDAHAQQRLANQREYNKALSEGRPATKVPTMEAWKQAGDNIKSGAYKGNPFATGNVDGIMSMFDQYGIQAPEGFRDQLIQFLGPQAPTSALTPPPAPGSPFTPSGGIPVAGQQSPMTGYPIGPNGEYWPGAPMPTNASGPGMSQPPRYNPDRPGGDYIPVGGIGDVDQEYQQWRAGIITDMRFRDPIERAAQERSLYEQFLRERHGAGMGQQSGMPPAPQPVTMEYPESEFPSDQPPQQQVPAAPPVMPERRIVPGRPRTPEEQASDEALYRRVAERAKQDQHASLVAEMQAKTPGHIPITRKPGDTRSVPWTPELGREGYQVTGWQRAPQQPTQPAQGQTTKSPPAPAAKPAPVGRANPIPERTQGTPLRRPKPATKKPSAQTRASDRKSQALLNQAMAMLRSGRRL